VFGQLELFGVVGEAHSHESIFDLLVEHWLLVLILGKIGQRLMQSAGHNLRALKGLFSLLISFF